MAEKEFVNLLHVMFVIDRSGSMAGRETDVIGGFNQYIADIKADRHNKYRVSLMTFNQDHEMILDDVSLGRVRKLTKADYRPSGWTALYDAMGAGMEALTARLRTEGKPFGEGNVLFVTITDGEENSSQQYTHHTLQAAISPRKDAGWQFVYLGDNVDVAHDGLRIGIGHGSTTTFQDTGVAYKNMAAATMDYATASSSARAGGQSASTDDFVNTYLGNVMYSNAPQTDDDKHGG